MEYWDLGVRNAAAATRWDVLWLRGWLELDWLLGLDTLLVALLASELRWITRERLLPKMDHRFFELDALILMGLLEAELFAPGRRLSSLRLSALGKFSEIIWVAESRTDTDWLVFWFQGHWSRFLGSCMRFILPATTSSAGFETYEVACFDIRIFFVGSYIKKLMALRWWQLLR